MYLPIVWGLGWLQRWYAAPLELSLGLLIAVKLAGSMVDVVEWRLLRVLLQEGVTIGHPLAFTVL